MEEKKLQAADKLAFVQGLYDYCGRAFNAQVRRLFAQRMGLSELTFRNKMYSQVGFKGQELDLVESLYCQVLGKAEFDRLFSEFLTRAADGDRRSVEAEQDREIATIAMQNESMAVAKILV